MRKLTMWFALAVLVAPAGAAKIEVPDVFTKMQPKVGAWGAYSWESKRGDKLQKKSSYRTAVVGKKGGDYWLEQKMELEVPKPKKDNGPWISKSLVGVKDGEVEFKKIYAKMGDNVIDMSSAPGSGERKKRAQMNKTKITEAGEETIKVAAGTFKTTHYTYVREKQTGEFWVKKGVGPYGLIKQINHNGKDVITLELQDSGGDAKSEIDETKAQSMFGAMAGRGARAGSATGSSDASAGSSASAGSGSSAGSSASSILGNAFGDALKRKALGSH